jgi:hypothetical protein
MNGKGYGGLLAQACFEYFLGEENRGDIKQVHATCSYLVKWVQKKEDFLKDKRLILYNKEKL